MLHISDARNQDIIISNTVNIQTQLQNVDKRTDLGKLLQNLGGLTHIRAHSCIKSLPNSRFCTAISSPERRPKSNTGQLFSLALKLDCVPYNCLWPCVHTLVV
jgi:hypothetical protein